MNAEAVLTGDHDPLSALGARAGRVVLSNLAYLRTLQVTDPDSFDHGAIWDTVQERVVGDNYATEEYAAALARHPRSDATGSFGLAMDFHARTTNGYPLGKHSEHTQHRRIGFLDALEQSRTHISANRLGGWTRCVESWRPVRANPNCNWHAMNALLDYMAYQITRSRRFWLHSWLEIWRMLSFRLGDGFFSDVFDSRRWARVAPGYCPIAYHAYTAALLHQHWLRSRNRWLRRVFLDAADRLLWLVPGSGHVAFRGRSAGHIFTYGAAFYVMAAGAAETGAAEYLLAADHILRAVEALRDPVDGKFPVVGTTLAYGPFPAQEPYAYHSVYNAHCSAWLSRARAVLERATGSTPHQTFARRATRTLPDAGLVAVREPAGLWVLSNGRGGNNDSALGIGLLDYGDTLLMLPPANRDEPDFWSAGHVVRLINGERVIASTVHGIGRWEHARTDGSITSLVGTATLTAGTAAVHLTRHYEIERNEARIRDRVEVVGALPTDARLEVQVGTAAIDARAGAVTGIRRLAPGRLMASINQRTLLLESQSGDWAIGDTAWSPFGRSVKTALSFSLGDGLPGEIAYSVQVK